MTAHDRQDPSELSELALRERIREVTQQQQAIRAQPGPHDQHLLDALSVRLDQTWDLLRQREALKDAGMDPSAARERPAREVEEYWQ